jgi:hypothetical protein
MRRALANGLLMLASAALTLGVAEIALRILAPQRREGVANVQDPVSGLSVTRSSGSALHEHGPRRVRYHFAAPHLRGASPRPNAFRVLAVGDSFTFGELLPDTATFLTRIEQVLHRDPVLTRVQLLNGGGRGYGVAEYVRYVERFGAETRPHALAVFLNSDDVGRVASSPLYRRVGDSLVALRAPIAWGKQIVNAIPGYAWAVERSHLAAFVRARLFVLLRGTRAAPDPDIILHGPRRRLPPAEASEAVERAELLFGRLAAWSRAHRVPLLVVTTGWAQPAHYGDPHEPTLRFLARAPAFFDSLGVPYHDLAPALTPVRLRDPARYVIAGDGHPSEAGAALIARFAAPVVGDWLRGLIATPLPRQTAPPPRDLPAPKRAPASPRPARAGAVRHRRGPCSGHPRRRASSSARAYHRAYRCAGRSGGPCSRRRR